MTKYRARNARIMSDRTGTSGIAKATGDPGVALAISQTKSVATTVSAKFGASGEVISAEVGWNITGSSSISISGSWKVPKINNSKKVKTGTLTAYAIYKVKSFVVDKMAWNSTKWEYQGTGNTSKAYGVSFKKTFTYQ